MKSFSVKPILGMTPKKFSSMNVARLAAGAIGKNKPNSRTSLLASEPMDGTAEDSLTNFKQLIKPDDQLNLTEAELKEEFSRVLTTDNPLTAHNLVYFNYQKGCFVPRPADPSTIVLIRLESSLQLKDVPNESGVSNWGSKIYQEEEEDNEKQEDIKEKDKEENVEAQPETEKIVEEDQPVIEEIEKGEDEEGDIDFLLSASKSKKKLMNAFNYCERAGLASLTATKEIATQTVPPPRENFSDMVTQWSIWDAYAEDYERQQKDKEKEKRPLPNQAGLPAKREEKRQELAPTATDALNFRMLAAANIIERIICQNMFDEIAQDYRYYEDPSDEYKEEGTLLPLWKFSYEKMKKNSVTGICWNPLYYDLFAVTFGTFEFSKKSVEGAVCLFSLKNPSYPYYVRHTDSAAVSIAIHPLKAFLIVIGLYDGNVAVYNTHLSDHNPQYTSNTISNKHWGVVWQVQWGVDLQDGEINFYSVSADGRVYNWVLMQNELSITLVISLTLPMEPISGPDGSEVPITGCGSTITFHPEDGLIFLVGSEEGTIYKCSTAYSSVYLFKYEAHHMPVHQISFNPFYPEIFISCSSDWRIKIWEDMRSDPLFLFDLGCPVGDVEWSPYSSTVFAAVTTDGKCHVFDLNVNKYRPICVQAVVTKKKNRLTRIRFNPRMPFLVVGDDRGQITALKLSPNLRLKTKPPKKQQFYEPKQLEIMKLEKLLALVREPSSSDSHKDSDSIRSD